MPLEYIFWLDYQTDERISSRNYSDYSCPLRNIFFFIKQLLIIGKIEEDGLLASSANSNAYFYLIFVISSSPGHFSRVETKIRLISSLPDLSVSVGTL